VLTLSLNSYLRTLESLFYSPGGSGIRSSIYYLFRKFISPVNKDLMSSGSTPRYFRLTYNILRFAFVSNAAILTIMIVQIITMSGFYVGLTILSMQANAVLTTVMFT
jgi:hypothetical protein